MSRIERAITTVRENQTTSVAAVRRPVVVVVADENPLWWEGIRELCDFLSVELVQLANAAQLPEILRVSRPMAVVAEMEGADQDGCHVLKIVAAHHPELPAMIVTANDTAMRAAAEAVQEIWGLSSVFLPRGIPNPGEFAEFLFYAGRWGNCLGLMPV